MTGMLDDSVIDVSARRHAAGHMHAIDAHDAQRGLTAAAVRRAKPLAVTAPDMTHAAMQP